MGDNEQVLVVCVAWYLAQLLTLQQLVELIKTTFVVVIIIILKVTI